MNVRGLVTELVVSYMNLNQIRFVSIKDFTKEFKGKIPSKIDLYRTVYGIGLNSKGFTIEHDGDGTFIRRV